MYKIGFVQPNFQTGPKHLNSFYLPYSLGVLWSYALKNQTIKDNFTVSKWVFLRHAFEKDLIECSKCDIVFLSLYVWNKNFCYKFAKELKKLNPNILIVLGGPQIEWKDNDYFDKHPYVDSIVIGEGEIAFQDLLLSFLNKEPIKQKYITERLKDLTDIPSPYTEGIFDNLLKEFPEITWTPTLETDRGCPYQCTFCDWGSATASKVYKFYFERIKNEIEWFGKNKVDYMHMTTANFGIFKERDTKIAQIIADTKRKYGYPNGLTVSFAKNSNADVLDIVQILQDAKIKTGFVVSLQTMTEQVLENIKRKNMNINKLHELKKLSDEKNIFLITELILGLPGESYDSWLDSIERTIQSGIMVLEVIYLQLIENAEMNFEQRQEYNMETFKAYDFFYDLSETENVIREIESGTAEDINIIKSTSSMSNNDFLNASLFSWFIFGTYSLGVTTHIADYMFSKHNVLYTDFHTKLFTFLKDNFSNFQSLVDQYYELHYDWYQKGIMTKPLDGLSVAGWNIVTSLPIIIHKRNILYKFIDSIAEFLKTEYQLDDNLVQDYRNLTKLFCKDFNNYIKQPVTLELTSNILPFKRIQVEDRYNDFPDDIESFLDQVKYARRKSWLLNLISNLDTN